MHQAQATSAVKEKPEKQSLGAMLHKIWNQVALAEQKWRAENTKRDSEVYRLWGIFGAMLGDDALYRMAMKHPNLTDDDKEFVRYMKNLGAPAKFQRKAKV